MALPGEAVDKGLDRSNPVRTNHSSLDKANLLHQWDVASECGRVVSIDGGHAPPSVLLMGVLDLDQDGPHKIHVTLHGHPLR